MVGGCASSVVIESEGCEVMMGKKFQKTFGKGDNKEVFYLYAFGNGRFGMKVVDHYEGDVSEYSGVFNSFREAAQWAHEIANNSDIGREVNWWMCEKTGLRVWND